MNNIIMMGLTISAIGVSVLILLGISAYVVNLFWIDPLEKSYNNNRNHITAITAQSITTTKNNYKGVA